MEKNRNGENDAMVGKKKLVGIKLAALSLTSTVLAAGLSACAPLESENTLLPSLVESKAVSEPSAPVLEYPEEWADNGIFSSFYNPAYHTLEQMTLEEKVGQLFLLRCDHTTALETISQYHLGGLVLFGKDFSGLTKEQVRQNIQSYQDASSIPLMIAVDEEGGTVVRISSNPQLADRPFSSPQKVFRQGGMDAIREDTKQKAELLKSLGINTNLAPVADVSTNSSDFIYDRSFGKSAEETADYVAAVVKTSHANGVSSVLKHFPGYGKNADTHTGIAVDERPWNTFATSDFLPFQAGIESGAECVMISHNIIQSMDADRPASLSPKVHQILRDTLGFTGLSITDDLAMGAISEYTGGKSPAVQAVQAGNNLLAASEVATGYQQVLEAVTSGEIQEEQLDHAVFRILAWKYDTGLLKE